MNLFVYRRSQQPRGSSLFNIGINEPLESQFQVQFSIPMFNNFFQNKLAMDRASVQLENDREVDRATRLRIEETVRVASLELTNQWESLRLAERSLEIAQEALRLAREEYRIGTRTFEDLRSSFDQEALTRRQVITSRHSFVDALLSLEVAVGERVRSAVVPSTRDVGAR
jgi:outer membrane protein